MATVSSCDVVRRCDARMPLELATAMTSVAVENDPYEMTPTASAAAITARTPSARSSGVALAVASAKDAGNLLDRRRLRQAAPVLELGGVPGDRPRCLGQPPEALIVDAVARGDSHAPPDDEAKVDLGVRLGDVLVDLAVGEAREPGVIGGDERFRFRRAGLLGIGKGSFGEREDARRIAAVVHHLPTPIWTSRKRAPEVACPTLAPWPGSPLPQFGVPSIT